jgi:hypothetical protein
VVIMVRRFRIRDGRVGGVGLVEGWGLGGVGWGVVGVPFHETLGDGCCLKNICRILASGGNEQVFIGQWSVLSYIGGVGGVGGRGGEWFLGRGIGLGTVYSTELSLRNGGGRP